MKKDILLHAFEMGIPLELLNLSKPRRVEAVLGAFSTPAEARSRIQERVIWEAKQFAEKQLRRAGNMGHADGTRHANPAFMNLASRRNGNG